MIGEIRNLDTQAPVDTEPIEHGLTGRAEIEDDTPTVVLFLGWCQDAREQRCLEAKNELTSAADTAG